MTSRLMEQLSEPAVLLALQMYFPDMLLVRLLSRRVPNLSSAEQKQTYKICTWIRSLKRRRRDVKAVKVNYCTEIKNTTRAKIHV